MYEGLRLFISNFFSVQKSAGVSIEGHLHHYISDKTRCPYDRDVFEAEVGSISFIQRTCER